MPTNTTPKKAAKAAANNDKAQAAIKRAKAAKKINGGVNPATGLPHTKTFIADVEL